MAFQYPSPSQSYTAMDMSYPASMANSQPPANFTMKEMNKPGSDPLDISGEKKRNRLGYARTNMACGNCRKRKIRCLLVKGDGRCTQCIRLKKDCHFYAVVQEPFASTGARAGSRLLSKTMLALATTSSSQMAPSQPCDMQAHPAYYGGTAASHDMSPPAFGADVYNEPSPGLPSDKPYCHGQSTDNWALTTEQGDINASWRGYPFEPLIATDYFPSAVPGSQTSMTWDMFPVGSTVEPEGAPSPENMWSPYPQSTRSMSFSGESPLQYRTYDDRKVSVASDICHPTSIETILYSTGQQPFQS